MLNNTSFLNIIYLENKLIYMIYFTDFKEFHFSLKTKMVFPANGYIVGQKNSPFFIYNLVEIYMLKFKKY